MSPSEHKKTIPDTVFLVHFNRVIFPLNLDEVIGFKFFARHNIPRNARNGQEVPSQSNTTSEVKKLVGDDSDPGMSTQEQQSVSSQGASASESVSSVTRPPPLITGSDKGMSNSGPKSTFANLTVKFGSSQGGEISSPGSPSEFKWNLIKDNEPLGKEDHCKEALQTILKNQQGLAIVSLSSEIPLMKRYLMEKVGLSSEEVDKIYFIPPIQIEGFSRNRSNIAEGYELTLKYFKGLGWDGKNGFIVYPFNEEKNDMVEKQGLQPIQFKDDPFAQLIEKSNEQHAKVQKNVEPSNKEQQQSAIKQTRSGA